MMPTRYTTRKPLRLESGEMIPAGGEVTVTTDRQLAQLLRAGAQLDPVPKRRRVRLTAAIVYEGQHTEPGTELSVSRELARMLVQANRAEDLGEAGADDPPGPRAA